ncbi:MAG: ribonuclease J [Acidimicrobiia bacterium]|nr:ribonuclease J [Acidimicrobiia bacterium]
MSDPVRLIFLGGLGEIGRNCFCIEIAGRLLVVDCGLMFPTEDMPGVDLVLPDLGYLEERAADLEAVLLTHGHEDHIGALPFLLERVEVPVYGTELTVGMVGPKLEERKVADRTRLICFGDGETVRCGPFEFTAIPVTHSVPHGVGFAFHTPQGTIVHTGDFKLDLTPVDGRRTDVSTFGELGKAGVRLLLSDSTNAEVPGVTGSERLVGEWLLDLFGRHDANRIVCACFASHLHRVQQVCDAALTYGRKIAFLGRSMLANTALARELGLLTIPDSAIINVADVDDYPPEQICIVCTGSQGEPLAALSLMAAGENRSVTISDDDTVVFSSSPIPGNEMNVHRAIDGLTRHGAAVVHSGTSRVHVSGHAAAQELEMMLSLTRPEFFVPVHGEYRHLKAHARLAEALGVEAANVVIAEDGDVVVLDDDGIHLAEDRAPGGYVYVDGSGVGDINAGVLRDRQVLSDDGVLIAVVGVDSRDGAIVRGPEIMSRGFLEPDASEQFAKEAADAVRQSIESAAAEGALDHTTLSRHVRQSLSRFANKRTRRRPLVFPLVIEL